MFIESVITVKCCCQDGKNHLQSSAAELGLGMEDDADGKLSQLLNQQHFTDRRNSASRKWLLCACEWVVLCVP